MSQKNPKVDAYLNKSGQWKDVMKKLRTLLLANSLTEEFKWGKPCYSYEDNKIAIIQGFREHCALMFFKGSLLKDPKKVLHKPGPSSQAARRFQFTSTKNVDEMKKIVSAYIQEAVNLEKSGAKVAFKKNPEPIPKELKNKFVLRPSVKKAFEALTPGRQRAYILYFSAAKLSETRAKRIEKCTARILSGKGLNDA